MLLSSLSAIRSLSADGCSLGGTLPSGIPLLRALNTLTLSNCGLSGTLPDVWSSLTALSYVFAMPAHCTVGKTARATD